jgi:hypothetical protein
LRSHHGGNWTDAAAADALADAVPVFTGGGRLRIMSAIVEAGLAPSFVTARPK